MKRFISVLGAIVALVMLAPRASAGCWCGAWQTLPASFNVCFKDESNSCSAGTFADAGQWPLANWNQFVDVWRVYESPIDSIGDNDGLNSAAFLSGDVIQQRYGYVPDPSVLGFATAPTTLGNTGCPLPDGLDCPYFGTSAERDVDVVLINTFAWTSYDSVSYQSWLDGTGIYNFQHVLEHEFGHAMGLGHESRTPAIMHPTIQPYRGVSFTGDDINVARLLYGTQNTGFSDVALMGYRFIDGNFSGARIWNDLVFAGEDFVTISDFSLTNRGAFHRDVTLEVTVGGQLGWTGTCNVDGYGRCGPQDPMEIYVSDDVVDAYAEVIVWIDPGTDDGRGDNNSLWLGYVEVVPAYAQDRDFDGYAPIDGDCVDADASISPVANEVCDGLDNDCDGETDRVGGQSLRETCYSGPSQTEGVAGCHGGTWTCADGWFGACVGEIVPSGEDCNGVDDDCDGRTDEGVTNACGGCGEVPNEACNGVDDDCDGQTDEGVTNACGTCGPVPNEVCNELDDDCDGLVDEGQKNVCGSCGPVPVETCNGIDDDCDGATDEGTKNLCGSCGAVPVEVCNGVDDDCDGMIDEGTRNACGDCGPVASETCNGIDDDCDGVVDEGVCPIPDPDPQPEPGPEPIVESRTEPGPEPSVEPGPEAIPDTGPPAGTPDVNGVSASSDEGCGGGPASGSLGSALLALGLTWSVRKRVSITRERG